MHQIHCSNHLFLLSPITSLCRITYTSWYFAANLHATECCYISYKGKHGFKHLWSSSNKG